MREYKYTLYTPEDIEADTWVDLHRSLKAIRAEGYNGPIQLMISGSGGNSSGTDAIIALIEADGNVHGYLLGTAYSGHASIFAACAFRYVMPYGQLAIHEAAFEIYTDQTVRADWLAERLRVATLINHRIARLFSSVSNRRADWWLSKMADAGSGYYYMTGAMLVEDLAMAKWAIE